MIRNQNRSEPYWGILGGWLLGSVVVLGIVGTAVLYFTTQTSVTCTVTDKDRTTTAEGVSDHRVYTEDCGTFKVGDEWLLGAFNASDTYSQIEIGDTYNFDVVGWRNGFLSLFPNILSATPR
jgi:hypothetical protein